MNTTCTRNVLCRGNASCYPTPCSDKHKYNYKAAWSEKQSRAIKDSKAIQFYSFELRQMLKILMSMTITKVSSLLRNQETTNERVHQAQQSSAITS